VNRYSAPTAETEAVDATLKKTGNIQFIWELLGRTRMLFILRPFTSQPATGSMRSSFMNWSKSGRTFKSSDSSVVSVAIPIHGPLRT
jgi:hypothetical protein